MHLNIFHIYIVYFFIKLTEYLLKVEETNTQKHWAQVYWNNEINRYGLHYLILVNNLVMKLNKKTKQ